MKKIYLSLLALCAVAQSQAQLTQSSHAPAAGETYQMNTCDSLGIIPGPGGANSNWNYTMTTHTSVLLTYNAVAASNPMFPSATVSVSANNSSTNNRYFSSTANSLLYYGGNMTVGSQVAASIMYTAPAVFAAYPMSLNTTTLSATGGSLNITSPISANGTFTGNCESKVDGTGTLTLPGNVYNNVMRVSTTETVNFTTGFTSGSMMKYTFEYYQNGIKAPVFVISSSTFTTPLASTTETMVMRMKPAASVGLNTFEKSSSQLSVFPNPASDVIHFVSNHNKELIITIYDLHGKKLMTATSTGEGVRTSELSEGIYIYEATETGGAEKFRGRFTVTR